MAVTSSTDPGDRSVAELERAVDDERARLGATIDALQSKASVGTLLDEVVKVVRENGGDMSRNLGRTVRDNPLPALLTGVGLAWLMAGSGRPSADWSDVGGRGQGDFPRQPIGVGDRMSAPEYGRGGAMAETTGYGSYSGGGGDDESESGFAERASGALSGAAERASGAMDELGARASGAVHTAGDALSGAGRSVRHAGAAAGAGLSRVGSRAADAGADARGALDDLLDEQPLVLGVLALAVGAAIGGAFPASQVENRAFGARAERAKQALGRMASEEGQKLKATAQAVAAEAADIVDETSAHVAERLPEGRSIADAASERVTEAASRLRDAAAEEAERQDLGHPTTR